MGDIPGEKKIKKKRQEGLKKEIKKEHHEKICKNMNKNGRKN